MLAVKRWVAAGLVGAMLAAAPLYGPSVVDSVRGGTAMAAEDAQSRTITVTGQGKITIQPDVAYVNFGVFSKAKTANEAQTANAQLFAAVEKVLTEQYKVAKKDIKTNGFQVYPEYTYPEKSQPQISGYTAEHNVVVTYRDLDQLGKLLDAVSKAGANRMNGIQFGTEKGEEYELQAIEKAMANADAKANAIAKHAKRTVKGVLNVQQSGVIGMPTPYYPIAKVAMESASADMASTSVQPGEMEYSTMVTVTYEM
ncbi:SIMPL domain-containing protein [Paenibacillus thermotolerans]|uniref:SIMPL domain-containing protein n=1 Tax=Paenibacillus thermotolerans TaxID=3027807 RepID=UPI002367C14D|nr:MULTISPECIES: SIMPL domain-containing protein [unclassified Paenibacillus]